MFFLIALSTSRSNASAGELSDLDKALFDASGEEDTEAAAAALKEGANINKSLSALGNVINALAEQAG